MSLKTYRDISLTAGLFQRQPSMKMAPYEPVLKFTTLSTVNGRLAMADLKNVQFSKGFEELVLQTELTLIKRRKSCIQSQPRAVTSCWPSVLSGMATQFKHSHFILEIFPAKILSTLRFA